MDVDVFLIALVNGIFVGLGVTLGTYIANKALIQQLEIAVNKLKKDLKNGKREPTPSSHSARMEETEKK